MQRKTVSRKRFSRQVTIRLDGDMYDQLATRAEAVAKKNPGMQVTVSDVIRTILVQALARQHLEDKAEALRAEAVQQRDT